MIDRELWRLGLVLIAALWSMAGVAATGPHGQCSSATCDHGTCQLDPPECVCDAGFMGDFCDKAKDSASCQTDIACGNGHCRVISNGSTKCVCEPGYTGQLCNDRVNACNANPCMNTGTCTSTETAPFFRCSCPPQIDVHGDERANHDPTTSFTLRGPTCSAVCIHGDPEMLRLAATHTGISEIMIASDITLTSQIKIGRHHDLKINSVEGSSRQEILIRAANADDNCYDASRPFVAGPRTLSVATKDRVVLVDECLVRVEFRDLVFTGGDVTAAAMEKRGGLVLVEPLANEVEFVRCHFSDGEAQRGGAVYTSSKRVTFDQCEFIKNKATSGGALAVGGAALVRDSKFRGNKATGEANFYCGGAILNTGTTHLISTTITGNECFGVSQYALGGAVVNTGKFMSMRHTNVDQNFAPKWEVGGILNGGEMVVSRSEIDQRDSSRSFYGMRERSSLYTDCHSNWTAWTDTARLSRGECLGNDAAPVECVADTDCINQQECETPPEGGCNSCFPGTVPGANGQCVDCSSTGGVLTLAVDGTIECKTCALKVPHCVACDVTPVGDGTHQVATCTSCEADSVLSPQGECLPCAYGTFAPPGSSQCISCPPGHSKCTGRVTNIMQGTSCKPDFVFDQKNQKCSPCTEDTTFSFGGKERLCHECSTTRNCHRCDANECQTCMAGYSVVDGMCEACTFGTAFSHDGDTNCTACVAKGCQTCEPRDGACLTCNASAALQTDGTCVLPAVTPEPALTPGGIAGIGVAASIVVVALIAGLVWKLRKHYKADDKPLDQTAQIVNVMSMEMPDVEGDGDGDDDGDDDDYYNDLNADNEGVENDSAEVAENNVDI